MFGLFNSSKEKIKVIDKVWMSKHAKWKACSAMVSANPACLFVAWFDDTFHELSNIVPAVNLVLASNLDGETVQGKMIVFAEHYPLAATEQELFSRLGLNEVPVLSSLDEPFFEKFGGQKTIQLMLQLGVKEDEVIGHGMITKSIQNAQSKISKKISFDHKSTSQKEWFERNL